MKFGHMAIGVAQERQYDGQAMGYSCARCRKYLHGFEEGSDWFAIPHVPIEIEGKKASNCVIVCVKCFEEINFPRPYGRGIKCGKIKQDGTKTIPYSELPYFSF